MHYSNFFIFAFAAFSVVAQKPDADDSPATIADKDDGKGSATNKTMPSKTGYGANYPKSTGKSDGGNKPGQNPGNSPLKGTASTSLMVPLSQGGGLVSIAGLGIAFAVFM